MCEKCRPHVSDLFRVCSPIRSQGRPNFVALGVCDGLNYLSWTCDGNGKPTASPFLNRKKAKHNIAVLPFHEDERLAHVKIATEAINALVRDESGKPKWTHESRIQTRQYYLNDLFDLVPKAIVRAKGAGPTRIETIESTPGSATLLISLE